MEGHSQFNGQSHWMTTDFQFAIVVWYALNSKMWYHHVRLTLTVQLRVRGALVFGVRYHPRLIRGLSK